MLSAESSPKIVEEHPPGDFPESVCFSEILNADRCHGSNGVHRRLFGVIKEENADQENGEADDETHREMPRLNERRSKECVAKRFDRRDDRIQHENEAVGRVWDA